MSKKQKTTTTIYVENDYHVKIKKNCVSCSSLCYDNNLTRHCMITESKVKKTDLCECWEMREVLKNAGRFTDGVVKDIKTKEVILR